MASCFSCLSGSVKGGESNTAQYVSLERISSYYGCYDSSILWEWFHDKFNLAQRWVVAKRSGLDFPWFSAAYLSLYLGLLGGRFLCGVFFCAEAVLDLRLGGSWKEGKGELGPPLLFAAFVVCKTSS